MALLVSSRLTSATFSPTLSAIASPLPSHRDWRRRWRCYSNETASVEEESDTDKAARVEWVQHIRRSDALNLSPDERFPRHWYTVTYSRSSGAGGQNVNKVSTKADVRFHLATAAAAQSAAAIGIVPPMPKSAVRYVEQHSSYYVASSHGLRVSSSLTRTQANNMRDALDKVRRHLVDLLVRDVRGETSKEQQDHVKKLVTRDKGRTKAAKEKRKDVKGGRRVSRGKIDF